MKHKRLLRLARWALLFFCALFQLGLLLLLKRMLPRFLIPVTALLYFSSLAHLLFLIFRSGERARVLLAGLILSFPLFGGMFCLIFGMLHRSRPPIVPPQTPAQNESDAVYYSTGAAFFDALCAAIVRAERSVYLEYYIFEEGVLWDRLLPTLTDAAARGVRVDLVADGFGSADFLHRGNLSALAERGITVHQVRPIALPLSFAQRIRDHRKLAVVDSRIAFFGGFNIADEYLDIGHPYGCFKDCGCSVTGGAVKTADRMRHTAHGSVEICGKDGAVLPFSSAAGSTEAELVFLRMCQSATARLVIATPYFVPSDGLLSELLLAAVRGVECTLILPARPDHPLVQRASLSYLAPLTRCGVAVYTYTPGFLHAKLMLADDRIAVVGSANWDIRSLALNAENGVVLTAPDAVNAIGCDLACIIAESKRLSPPSAIRAPLSALLRFLAPLF